MPGNTRHFTPTGRVPDMLAKIGYTNIDGVKEDLSRVRTDIDSLRSSLTQTRAGVAADSKDILARCSFYTDVREFKGGGEDGKRESGGSLESDLRETNNAMKEIERTVNSFSKQPSVHRKVY